MMLVFAAPISLLVKLLFHCDINMLKGLMWKVALKRLGVSLKDALLYRNVAEQLREKRALHNKLTEKCETICNFWCNNLVEGCSRGGRMVREALYRQQLSGRLLKGWKNG